MLPKIKSVLFFPIDMLCLFLMGITFGLKSTNRMLQCEREYLSNKLKKLK